MEIQEFFKVLLKNKFLLLVIPLISACLAFFLKFSTDRAYIAESQVSTGLTLGTDLTGDNNSLSPFEVGLSFGNITENMTSKLIANRLSYKLLYRELSDTNPFRTPSFETLEINAPKGDTLELILTELEGAIQRYQLINRANKIGNYIDQLIEAYGYSEEELLSDVFIKRVGNTDFINIRFSSESPNLSAHVANEWMDNFIEYYNHQKFSYLNESLEVLSNILKEKQGLLDQSTSKLNKYKTRYLYRSTETDSDPLSEYERLIREQESVVTSLKFRLNSIINQIASTDKSSSPSNNRQKIVDYKKRIEQINNQLAISDSSKNLTDSLEYYKRELKFQLYMLNSSGSGQGRLDNLLDEENELTLEYKIGLSELEKLKNQYEIEKGMAQNLSANKSILENLETEVQQAREELVKAQDKYNQARSKLLSGGGSIKQSYYSDIPEDPQSRMTIIFTLAGLMGGFFISLFTIVFLEIIDFRMKNIFKFRRSTELIPDGMIPKYSKLDKKYKGLIEGNSLSYEGASGNKFIQMIKKSRFKILSKAQHQVIMVTSLRPQAGKSFFLSTLAYSFSLLEKKVVIVDTNFRNNELTNSIASKENDSNKASAEKTIKIDDDYNSYLIGTNNSYIKLVTGAQMDKTPEEVFTKLSFDTFLESLKKSFDIVLFEGPAMNEYSDSRELIQYADVLVSVYSALDTFNTPDSESLDFLKNSDDKLTLNVLNKVNKKDVE